MPIGEKKDPLGRRGSSVFFVGPPVWGEKSQRKRPKKGGKERKSSIFGGKSKMKRRIFREKGGGTGKRTNRSGPFPSKSSGGNTKDSKGVE